MGRKSISHIRKPEILKNTYKVVEEEGFMGMTIGKVASRMGVNSGLLIHYFKSKEGLIMEMVDYLYDQSLNRYREELNKLRTPEERVEDLLDILFDPSGVLPQLDGVFWSCYAMGFRNDQIKEKIQGLMTKFIEFGMAEIETWEKNGLVKVADKKKASATIVALSEGFDILRHTLDDMATLTEISLFMKQATLNALGMKELPK
jgi:AcrR family transcriptional regulator